MDQRLQLEEYKYFFEDTPVAFVRTDLETGEFLMANKFAATMLGFDSVDELIAYGNSRELYPDSERKKLIKEIQRTGEVNKYEIKFSLPNGRSVWAAANLHINCGGSCIEGCLVDITDQKVNLKEAHRMQLQKISDISKKIDQALRASA